MFSERNRRCRLTGGPLGNESTDDHRVKPGVEEPPQPGVRGHAVERSAPATPKCLLVCDGGRRRYGQSHLISREAAHDKTLSALCCGC